MKKLLILVPIAMLAAALIPPMTQLSVTPPQAKHPPLVDIARTSIEMSNPRISPGRRELLASLLADVATKRISDPTTREFFIALVAIESRFDSAARSSVGAIGLSQLMPKYQASFAEACGLPEFQDSDLHHDFVNLTLGACYFDYLVKRHNSIVLGLISFNSGPYSHSIQRAKRGDAPVHESAAHVSKIVLHHEVVTKKGK